MSEKLDVTITEIGWRPSLNIIAIFLFLFTIVLWLNVLNERLKSIEESANRVAADVREIKLMGIEAGAYKAARGE